MITPNEFQEHNQELYAPRFPLTDEDSFKLNWIIGLAGETGEVAELVKHDIFHGQAPDKMKIAKELGDVLWYIGALAESYGISLQNVMELNLAKLNHRYGAHYNAEGSAERHKREEAFEQSLEYRTLHHRINGTKGEL